jgi:hypothetical protein
MFATAQTPYFLLLQYYYNKFEARLRTKDEGIRAEGSCFSDPPSCFLHGSDLMKHYTLLRTAAQLVTIIAFLSMSLAGAHAQGAQGGMLSSESRSSKAPKQPCANPLIKCPGGMKCIDDPSDKCDPAKDHINCAGICVAGAPVNKSSPVPDDPAESSVH